MALLSKQYKKPKVSIFPKQCADAFWPACRGAPPRVRRKHQKCALHHGCVKPGQSCVNQSSAPVSNSDHNAFWDFLFVGIPSQARPLDTTAICQMFSETVVGTLTGLATLKVSIAGSPAVGACLPIIVPFTTPFEVEDGFWVLSARALKIQKMLITVAFLQGALSLSRALLGDVWGGAIGIGMASMGFYSCTPSGVRWLPTYTVVTFFNGSFYLLQLVEIVGFTKGSLITMAQPAVMNLVNLLVISAPVISLTAVVCSYQFIKELRRLASAGHAADEASTEGPANTTQNHDRGPWQPFAGEGHRIEVLPRAHGRGTPVVEDVTGRT